MENGTLCFGDCLIWMKFLSQVLSRNVYVWNKKERTCSEFGIFDAVILSIYGVYYMRECGWRMWMEWKMDRGLLSYERGMRDFGFVAVYQQKFEWYWRMVSTVVIFNIWKWMMCKVFFDLRVNNKIVWIILRWKAGLIITERLITKRLYQCNVLKMEDVMTMFRMQNNMIDFFNSI